MYTNRKAAAALILSNVFAGFALASQALADEPTSNYAASGYSSSARASAFATVVERPDFSCSRVLNAVTAEVTAMPRLAGDHRHPMEIPRLDCSYRNNMINVSFEMTSVETATHRPGPAASDLKIPVSVDTAARPAVVHQHVVEVIYNFE